MFDFLKKQPPAPAQQKSADELLVELNSAIRLQLHGGVISTAELEKIVNLVNSSGKLRLALNYL